MDRLDERILEAYDKMLQPKLDEGKLTKKDFDSLAALMKNAKTLEDLKTGLVSWVGQFNPMFNVDRFKKAANMSEDEDGGWEVDRIDEANMQVANTIKNQLGNKALVMMGAKNLAGGADYLSFKIGRNAKGVNYIKITLTPMDLYDVEFGNIRGMKYTVKKTVKGIYADQLHDVIEEYTGMYLSLGTMGR